MHGSRNHNVVTCSAARVSRRPMRFTEVYLGYVTVADFRKNPRGELGTRTATVDKHGIQKLRSNWIYILK